MCLILVAWKAHPQYPLVLAANRDEFFARPAEPAHWWPQPRILAGRDGQAGGTWLGLASDGRFAALTNYRDPGGAQRPQAPSRGELVPETLAAKLTASSRLQQLHERGAHYNGFNLLFSDGEQLAIYESVPDRGALLSPGVYGLSNHLLDTPWPKVMSAKAALAQALAHLPDETPLLHLLRDQTVAPDEQLPRTGLTLEWERLVSSAFVRAPGYGTRCSTIALIDRHGQASLTEWSWDPAAQPIDHRDYRFAIQDA
jgi:uncharacterized protein with NRDE domain